MAAIARPAEVRIGPSGLTGLLGIPDRAQGLVIFAHGSGSGRHSPRNTYVAERLRRAGLATLLLDLLTQAEERDRGNVFDIRLLASRLTEAMDWSRSLGAPRHLPIGLFGASTGGGAALAAAAEAPDRVGAVVSRGGRPDLAGVQALANVRAPTLLIVGSRDEPVIALNQEAMRHLRCPRELVLVPGATHLFEEPGTLDSVVDHATTWFRRYLTGKDRDDAGVS